MPRTIHCREPLTRQSRVHRRQAQPAPRTREAVRVDDTREAEGQVPPLLGAPRNRRLRGYVQRLTRLLDPAIRPVQPRTEAMTWPPPHTAPCHQACRRTTGRRETPTTACPACAALRPYSARTRYD